MAVEIANTDIAKLTELIEHLHNLPQPAFDRLMVHLESVEITGKPEEERLPLWTKLVHLVSKHKKYSDTKWALRPDFV